MAKSHKETLKKYDFCQVSGKQKLYVFEMIIHIEFFIFENMQTRIFSAPIKRADIAADNDLRGLRI